MMNDKIIESQTKEIYSEVNNEILKNKRKFSSDL